MSAKTENIVIEEGKTYTHVIRWGDPEYEYDPITAITQSAPVVITSTGHGVPDGWDVAIVSVKGMTQINASNSPPKDKDFVPCTKVDANTITINSINTSLFTVYKSGGYIQYRKPHALAAVTVRMTIKDKLDGVVLASTEGTSPVITATVSDPSKTITINITATSTATFDWKKGVYEIEGVDGSTVYSLMSGAVTVPQEIVT